MRSTNSQQSSYQMNNFFKICAMEIHIGELIKQTAKDIDKPISKLASEINTGKRNMYQILERNDMMVSQLWNISKSLNYNFFQEFHPIVTQGDQVEGGLRKTADHKSEGKEYTLKVEFKYHMEDADQIGKFLMHVDALGEKLGFKLV